MEEQYKNHVLFVTDDDGKKYLRFEFIIVPSKTLPKETLLSDNVDDEGYAIVSKRSIAYVHDIKNATVLNNSTENTKHIHGVYYEELSQLNGYISVEVL